MSAAHAAILVTERRVPGGNGPTSPGRITRRERCGVPRPPAAAPTCGAARSGGSTADGSVRVIQDRACNDHE